MLEILCTSFPLQELMKSKHQMVISRKYGRFRLLLVQNMEASASRSHLTKEPEVYSKSSTSSVPLTSGTSQSSLHADSSQVSVRSLFHIPDFAFSNLNLCWRIQIGHEAIFNKKAFLFKWTVCWHDS